MIAVETIQLARYGIMLCGLRVLIAETVTQSMRHCPLAAIRCLNSIKQLKLFDSEHNLKIYVKL